MQNKHIFFADDFQVVFLLFQIGDSNHKILISICVMKKQGFGRTSAQQAGYQALGIVSTVFLAIVFGILTGLILELPSVRRYNFENK